MPADWRTAYLRQARSDYQIYLDHDFSALDPERPKVRKLLLLVHDCLELL